MEPKGQLLQGSELTERRMPPPLGTTPKRSALKRSALPNAAPLAPLTVERPLGGTLSGPASARASSDEIEQSEDVRINRKLSWHDHHGLQLLQVHNVHDTHYQRGPCARWRPLLRFVALFAGTLLMCFSITNAILRVTPNLFAAGPVRGGLNSTLRASQG